MERIPHEADACHAAQRKRLARLWLDIAEKILLCGAEIHRGEETLERLAKAYGASRADVFVITNSIVCTFGYEGDETFTVSRRVRGNVNTDFMQLERLNALVRRVCESPVSEDELRQGLEDALKTPNFPKIALGRRLFQILCKPPKRCIIKISAMEVQLWEREEK